MEIFSQLAHAFVAVNLSAAAAVFLVGSFTPGPNNLMLMISGVRVGARRTLPHVWGIVLGIFLLILGLGVFLDLVADLFPPILLILRLIFSGILFWLAYKIATAKIEPDEDEDEEEDPLFPIPFGFWRGFFFQWVNPKAWAVHAFIIVSCGSGNPTTVASEALVVAIFGAPFTIGSAFTWVIFGVSLRGWLREPRRARIFYRVMGVLLALVVILVWI